MKRFRGGLVFKSHRLLYHSTLGSKVIKKRRRSKGAGVGLQGHSSCIRNSGFGLCVRAFGFRVEDKNQVGGSGFGSREKMKHGSGDGI